ncbi:MAG: transcriptional repressor LexA [Fibrobacteres bacterium]|nr:transcriptional repressor LexA [Fibrobacterota bacterium]
MKKNETELTERQQEVLNYIKSYMASSGMPPTFREIGDHFDIQSTNGVRCLLMVLEKKGYLRLIPKVSRGIQLTETTEEMDDGIASIPMLGRIAAGSPILTAEASGEKLEFPTYFGKSKGTIFALKVQGESMIGEGIFDGDTVIVESANEARNGDIVAAFLNGEATVKTYTVKGGKIELLPANPAFNPIPVSPEDDFRIAGKIKGLVRKY